MSTADSELNLLIMHSKKAQIHEGKFSKNRGRTHNPSILILNMGPKSYQKIYFKRENICHRDVTPLSFLILPKGKWTNQMPNRNLNRHPSPV